MKLNSLKWLACGLVAALTLMTAGSALAQNDNNGGPGGDNGGRQRNRGGWDPAKMQQQIMERIQDELGITNDTDWSAIQPLVQKVLETQRDMRGQGMMRLMGRGSRGGKSDPNQGRHTSSSFFGQPSQEAEALQKAVDDGAPSGQIKDLLARYQAAQKAKQAKLEQAQSDLRAVLTTKQEAAATLLGIL